MSGQTELIFVNDGSRDQSLALIRALAEEDSRVRYVESQLRQQNAVAAGLNLSTPWPA